MTIQVNGGEEKQLRFMTAVDSISRFVLRTGAPRMIPSREDDPIEDTSYELLLADEKDQESVYELTQFRVSSGREAR